MDWLINLIFLPLYDWRVTILLGIVGLYVYQTWNYGYFKSSSLSNPKPYPFIGTSYILFSKNGATTGMLDVIRKHGKIVGMFAGRRPELLVADEPMLKEILVKQFASFPDHNNLKFGNEYVDRILTSLRGDEWRRVRRSLTPTFTVGKLKKMTGDMKTCCEEMVKSLEIAIDSANEIEMKGIIGNFAMDVIGRTTFGVETNTQKNPNNEFVKHGKEILLPDKFEKRSFILLAAFMCPSIVPYLAKIGIEYIPKSCTNFFCGIVDHLLDARENEIESRNDFMAMMASAHKLNQQDRNIEETVSETEKGLDKVDIIASGFAFFLAGFDTVSSGISVCCYHIANNTEWQDKVVEEIQTVLHDEEVSYNALNEMQLLEMCIDESFRLSPPASITDRVATEDITIGDIKIKKGMHIWIPIYAIHHLPDYYPDPEKFDPMRFTSNAKAERSKFVYLPFGMGPRDCIGKRLAMMELKMALVYILRSFKLTLASGDRKSLKFNNLGQLQETWITIEKRKIGE